MPILHPNEFGEAVRQETPITNEAPLDVTVQGRVLDDAEFGLPSPVSSINEQAPLAQTPVERKSFLPAFLQTDTPEDEFIPYEVADVPALERAKEMPRAIGEVGTHVVGGAAAWMPAMVAKFGQVGFHQMTNAIAGNTIAKAEKGLEVNPKELEAAKAVMKSPGRMQELGRESEELLSSYFGALPDVETESGKRLMNVVGKAMHTITAPARKIASAIPEEYPNLRDFVQFLGEAGTFAATGKAGKSAGRKIKAINRNIKEGKFSAAEGQTKGVLAKMAKDKPEVVTKDGVPDLSTPALRQKFIDAVYGETLTKKNQARIDAIRESELGTEVPAKMAAERAYEGQTGERIVPPEAQRIMDAAERATIAKKLKEQKGELTIDRLTPGEKATIERLTREAGAAGLEVEKHLRQQGIKRGEARNIARLSREIESTKVKDPMILEEGEARVNTTPKANPAVAVGENMLRELKGLERTTTPGMVKGFTTSLQGFNKLRSPALKGLYTKYKENNKARFEDTKVVEGQLKGLSKEFSNRKLRQEAGAKGLARTPNGADALAKMGVKVKEGPVKYDPLLEKLEPMFESLYDRLNETRVSIGKKPLRKLDQYLPFFAQEQYFDTLNRLFKGKKEVTGKPNMVLDSAEAIAHRHKPGTVEATNFAHVKRGKLRSGTHLELDPLQLYARYSNTALNHIHMSPINAFVKELVTKPLKDPKTGEVYQLSNSNREVADFLGQWSNSIAGVENVNVPKFLSKAARKISNNLTAATLYYSLRTMMVQPTALLPTATEFGYGNTTKGLMRTIKRSKKDPIHLSNELEPRVFDVFLNDVAQAFGGTPAQKAKVKVKEWGIAGMKALDYVAAEATWRTAFNTAKGRMSKREAATFADEAVVRTQGSGARGDLSPIQMNSLGKAATLWQTFTINNANFIARDVLGIKNPEVRPKDSAARVMRYVIGSAAISTLFEDGLGIQSPQPAPIKEIVKGLERGDASAAIALKTMMELAEIVPIGSSLKFGSHPAGPVIGYFGDLTEAFSGNDLFHKDLLPKALEGDKRSMVKIAELIGKGVGVPGTGQAVKYVRGRERGESVVGAVLGRFDPEQAKQAKRRGRSSRRQSRRSRRSQR